MTWISTLSELQSVFFPGISPQRKVGQKSCIQVPYRLPSCPSNTACWWHNQAWHTSHHQSFWQSYFSASLVESDCCVVHTEFTSACSFAHRGYSFCCFSLFKLSAVHTPPLFVLHYYTFSRADKHPPSSLWPNCLSLPDYGTIRKVLSPLNQSTGSCLLEEIELFPPRKRQPIRSLLILHSRSELYVGVRDQVIKIPLKRCSYHKSREWVHVQIKTPLISVETVKSKYAHSKVLKLPLS